MLFRHFDITPRSEISKQLMEKFRLPPPPDPVFSVQYTWFTVFGSKIKHATLPKQTFVKITFFSISRMFSRCLPESWRTRGLLNKWIVRNMSTYRARALNTDVIITWWKTALIKIYNLPSHQSHNRENKTETTNWVKYDTWWATINTSPRKCISGDSWIERTA